MRVTIIRNDYAEYTLHNVQTLKKMFVENYEIRTSNQFEGFSLIYIPVHMVKLLIVEGEEDAE